MSFYNSIQEFIDDGNAFYHISQKKFRDRMLRDGLLRKMGSGTYVTRSADIQVARSIFEEYCLVNLDSDELGKEFQAMIVRIDPKRLGISAQEIAVDPAINSLTLITQNIIRRARIPIELNDISFLDSWRPVGFSRTHVQVENQEHPSEIGFTDTRANLIMHRFVVRPAWEQA